MKNIYPFIFLLITTISSCFLTHGQDNPGERTTVKMGVSQVNITPDVPIPMSGYGSRKDPFTGVHDELFASALYFRSPETDLLLITSDLIGFNMQFVDETRKMISARIGIPPENIMITAVHNHGGPVTKTYEEDVPEEVENYVKGLQEKFITMSVKASEKTVPFRMGTGKGFCDLNINRRAEFADGSIGLGRDQGKPCDHDLDVVKFEDLNGNTLAIMVNWPCHGTASGPQNYQITGDWPGAAARHIKKQTGEEIVVVITAGASGDINPIYGPGNSFSEIETVGYHVGKAALETFNTIKTFPVESVDAIYTSMTFPGKKACENNFPQETYEPGPDVEIRLTAFRIGHLVLAGISGEVMNEIGQEIKKQSPYKNTTIITHCNGSSGYICTDKAFPEGGYEVKVTRLMPGAEKPLTTQVLEMIRKF
jgi:neutral ceramidase